MAEEWIVRVQGKEYGPVDVETLVEWRDEGRVLSSNQARRADADLWITAAEIPGLFEPAPVASGPAEIPLPRRSFGHILAETLRIYRKGFFQFFYLTLLVAMRPAPNRSVAHRRKASPRAASERRIEKNL